MVGIVKEINGQKKIVPLTTDTGTGAPVGTLISQYKKVGAPNSAVGDWKIIKCYEASLEGHELPYDITELMEARQAVRDEINELQAELETLEGVE